MALGSRSKGEGRIKYIEEDAQRPHTPEFTGEEDTLRSPDADSPERRLHSEPSVADRLDRLKTF